MATKCPCIIVKLASGGALARLREPPELHTHTGHVFLGLIGGAGLEVGAGLVSLGTTAASREAGEALLFAGDSLYWCTVRMLFVTLFVIASCAGGIGQQKVLVGEAWETSCPENSTKWSALRGGFARF